MTATPPPPEVPSTPSSPAPAAQPPAAAPPAVPSTPVGAHRKVRSSVSVILLSLVTLGIYFLVWTYKVFQELKDNTGEGIGGVIGLVIQLVFSPVNWFVLPSEIGNMYAKAGLEKPVRGVTGFWWFLPFVGGIIWIVKVQGALNRRWETLGPTE